VIKKVKVFKEKGINRKVRPRRLVDTYHKECHEDFEVADLKTRVQFAESVHCCRMEVPAGAFRRNVHDGPGDY